jgi:hypothetical protein
MRLTYSVFKKLESRIVTLHVHHIAHVARHFGPDFGHSPWRCQQELRRVGGRAHAHEGGAPGAVRSDAGAISAFNRRLSGLGRGSKMSGTVHSGTTAFFVRVSIAMLRWFYVVRHLLVEAIAARRDARVRFLKAEVEILRRKLGGNRVIPSPEDRCAYGILHQQKLKRERWLESAGWAE